MNARRLRKAPGTRGWGGHLNSTSWNVTLGILAVVLALNFCAWLLLGGGNIPLLVAIQVVSVVWSLRGVAR